MKEEEAVMEKKLNHIVNDMNCGEFCKIMATTLKVIIMNESLIC